VIVFDASRPVRREAKFNTSTDRAAPAGLIAGARKDISRLRCSIDRTLTDSLLIVGIARFLELTTFGAGAKIRAWAKPNDRLAPIAGPS